MGDIITDIGRSGTLKFYCVHETDFQLCETCALKVAGKLDEIVNAPIPE